MRKSDITIERTSEGALRLYALVNGYLETRSYYDYSKREALELFINEFKNN